MFRKLIALALLAAGIAAAIRKSQQSGAAASSPEPFSQPAQPADADDLAEVREGQTQDTVESPVVGADGEEAAIPDISDDDPLVRQEEKAAAAGGAAVGGEVDSVTADLDPEVRPVYEGSGDAPETLETLEEEGR
jgi:hypothetical protein